MSTDLITIEVISNGLKALIHEMDAAIERTAMSIIIREQHDFGMSLIDHRGWVIAGTPFPGTSLADYAATHPVEPGDVILFNDPYIAKGEISHLGDTMLAVPVFASQKLIAWGIAWGHHMDLGASAPASMPPSATEVFHEGIQIPPVKLYRAGELQQDLIELIARNSRTPDMMVGDLLSLSAAGKIAEKRVTELCEKFGETAVIETFGVLFERARSNMVKLIQMLPEEPVSFEDYLDNDGITNSPLTIRMTIQREGDRLHIDYDGTSPECEGPVNYPLNPSIVKMDLYNDLRLAAGHLIDIDPELDANQGVEDLMDVSFPEDCFLAPKRPAPVSLRHLSIGRVDEVRWGVLAQIFPDAIWATHNGSLNCYSLLGRGKEPEDRWLCFEVMAAGSGGKPQADGLDAYSWNTRLKNAPVEFVETVYPVRVEEYSLRAGSSGPGKHRGGFGLIRAIRTLRRARLSFLDERQQTQPWGLYGGKAAAPNDCFIQRNDGAIEQMPSKFDHVDMNVNDIWVMRTGGGGGWGDPYERDPETVARDVKTGLISPEQAREAYGVVMSAGGQSLDATATTEARASHTAPDDWIDRGTPQASPSPKEVWVMDTGPEPWLEIDKYASQTTAS